MAIDYIPMLSFVYDRSTPNGSTALVEVLSMTVGSRPVKRSDIESSLGLQWSYRGEQLSRIISDAREGEYLYEQKKDAFLVGERGGILIGVDVRYNGFLGMMKGIMGDHSVDRRVLHTVETILHGFRDLDGVVRYIDGNGYQDVTIAQGLALMNALIAHGGHERFTVPPSHRDLVERLRMLQLPFSRFDGKQRIKKPSTRDYRVVDYYGIIAENAERLTSYSLFYIFFIT